MDKAAIDHEGNMLARLMRGHAKGSVVTYLGRLGPVAGDPRACLVLEPLGKNLSDWLVTSARRVDDFALKSVVKQLIKAVEAIHDLNVVHLDLKLSQFCLDKEHGIALIKVFDFDCAQYLSDRPLKDLEHVTPTWAAFEVANALDDDGKWLRPVLPSKAIDLYGLSLILFKVFTRSAEDPFADLAEARAGPPSLDGLKNGSDRELVASLCSRVPDQRTSAAQLLASAYFNGNVTQMKAIERRMEGAASVRHAESMGMGGKVLSKVGESDGKAAARHGESMAAHVLLQPHLAARQAHPQKPRPSTPRQRRSPCAR